MMTIVVNDGHSGVSYLTKRIFINVSPTITNQNPLPTAKEGVDYNPALLDPAVGATNYQAPGADRYVITLTLITLPLTLGNDDDFIELVRSPKYNQYSIDALAKEAGFNSRHHLYKPFKKFHGGTPSDFISSVNS